MSKIDFPKIEQNILKYWNEIKAFEGSLKLSKKFPTCNFYDGPPFATGLPHYGHILASVIKDVIPRYMTQTGKHVERRWGWDCHGVPIEFEIEKKLGIKTKSEIENLGIKKYSQECRNITMNYSPKWKQIMQRMGRWVDFEGSYKTLDTPYMESVWWVFKTLHIKNLVYQGNRVMPYSAACSTPLSNFESSQNYKTISDPSLYVKFQLTDSNEKLLVWTTTPWSLPGNVAICMHPDTVYVTVEYNGEHLVVSKDSLENAGLSKSKIIREFNGSALAGKHYLPLFNFFKSPFRIVTDCFIETKRGTGIVHMAPAFGPEDYKICLSNKIISKEEDLPCPFDDNCNFTEVISDELPEAVGINFRESNKYIIKVLKQKELVFKSGSITHEYPFCWRSDTPLMYRTVPCWFININRIRDRMLKNLDETYWVPNHIKTNRFVNWIKGNGSETVDWCVSRNRYWGTPIPIWTNGHETIVIGSISELEERANLPAGSVEDLHRSTVDHILIPSKIGGKPLRRIPEVFDCWFESGSMPYASVHYPFSISKERFIDTMFPAEFIAEGVDQTRGWFYTLNILSTALFDKPAFRNVIVNGLVLAEDGEKMSKRKQNYPLPELIFDKYGADATRLYLTSSKAVHAEDLKFSETNIEIMMKNILIPLHHSITLLTEFAGNRFSPISLCVSRRSNFTNPLDNWILQMLDQLLINYHADMSVYKLQRIVHYFTEFIDYFSRWYINLNKKRIKRGERKVLSVIYHCLFNFCLVLAPFAPFNAEYSYQKLRRYDSILPKSVHWCQMPQQIWYNNKEFIETVKQLFTVIELVRTLRSKHQISFKRPLNSITIFYNQQRVLDNIKTVDQYLLENCNIMDVHYSTDVDRHNQKLIVTPNFKTLGKKYGHKLKIIKNKLTQVPREILIKLRDGKIKNIELELPTERVILTNSDIKIRARTDETSDTLISGSDFIVQIDRTINKEIEFQYESRKLTSFINQMRSNANLRPRDHVLVYYRINNSMSDLRRQASQLQQAATLFKEQEKFLQPVLNYTIHEYSSDRRYFYQEMTNVFGISVVLFFSEIDKFIPPTNEGTTETNTKKLIIANEVTTNIPNKE